MECFVKAPENPVFLNSIDTGEHGVHTRGEHHSIVVIVVAIIHRISDCPYPEVGQIIQT